MGLGIKIRIKNQYNGCFIPIECKAHEVLGSEKRPDISFSIDGLSESDIDYIDFIVERKDDFYERHSSQNTSYHNGEVLLWARTAYSDNVFSEPELIDGILYRHLLGDKTLRYLLNNYGDKTAITNKGWVAPNSNNYAVKIDTDGTEKGITAVYHLYARIQVKQSFGDANFVSYPELSKIGNDYFLESDMFTFKDDRNVKPFLDVSCGEDYYAPFRIDEETTHNFLYVSQSIGNALYVTSPIANENYVPVNGTSTVSVNTFVGTRYCSYRVVDCITEEILNVSVNGDILSDNTIYQFSSGSGVDWTISSVTGNKRCFVSLGYADVQAQYSATIYGRSSINCGTCLGVRSFENLQTKEVIDIIIYHNEIDFTGKEGEIAVIGNSCYRYIGISTYTPENIAESTKRASEVIFLNTQDERACQGYFLLQQCDSDVQVVVQFSETEAVNIEEDLGKKIILDYEGYEFIVYNLIAWNKTNIWEAPLLRFVDLGKKTECESCVDLMPYYELMDCKTGEKQEIYWNTSGEFVRGEFPIEEVTKEVNGNLVSDLYYKFNFDIDKCFRVKKKFGHCRSEELPVTLGPDDILGFATTCPDCNSMCPTITDCETGEVIYVTSDTDILSYYDGKYVKYFRTSNPNDIRCGKVGLYPCLAIQETQISVSIYGNGCFKTCADCNAVDTKIVNRVEHGRIVEPRTSVPTCNGKSKCNCHD